MDRQEIENLYGIGTVHTKISELFTEFTEKLLLLVENGGTKSQLLVGLAQCAQMAHQAAEVYISDIDKVLPKIENDEPEFYTEINQPHK